MFTSKAITFSALALTLAVFIGAPVFVLHASPYMQPGQNWSIGLLAGGNLRLLESGRYVHQSWCDICPNEMIVDGTWQQSGDWLLLKPSASERPERRLRAATIKGCPMLIPLQDGELPKWISHSTVYSREGDHCVVELDMAGHTGKLLRDLR
ncbi:hypothetical protein [Lysobacter sp. Root690]|uniref:hypothetical protein n=1 Tax=Lysobacter sp. Root690 TaxID=1736588 RepID=UPI0006F256F1|nr:hypothetical protein [Lysobacter sp. Root690]KRB11194.1 hypothetical protein ASD86_01805 [Lysobacter sp. Root690]